MRRAALIAASALGLAVAAAPAAGAPTVLAELQAGADVRDVGRDNGVTLVRSFPQIGWAEYAIPADDPPAAARSELLDDGRVFRLDFQRPGEPLEPVVVPNDQYTRAPFQGSFGSGTFRTDYPWQQAKFYLAWDRARASRATTIAVLDDEIDVAHPELGPKVVAAYNAERQHPLTYGTADTRASAAQLAAGDLHGSHVAGAAAATTDNGPGVSSAGFHAGLIPVKITLTVSGGGGTALYVANAMEGIIWAADHGARIVNMSFGTTENHPGIADAVAYAASKDVLLVAAAGNSQDDGVPVTPIYPAALPNVLAVGATNPDETIASFSTNGDYVDVAAPGVFVLSTWDLREPGVFVGGSGNQTGYEVLSGTSMASPIVAGLGALVRDLRPDLRASQVEAIIAATAVDRGAPGRDAAFGVGLIDANAAVQAAAVAVSAPPDPPRAPAAAPGSSQRASVRIRYRCAVGERAVSVGAARRLRVAPSARLVCRGRTIPALGRLRLQVERLARGRKARIAVVPTKPDGRFGFSVRIRKLGVGPITVRATLPRTAAHAAATGPAARLTVTARR